MVSRENPSITGKNPSIGGKNPSIGGIPSIGEETQLLRIKMMEQATV